MFDDQGIRYELAAVIGRLTTLRQLVRALPGAGVVPLTTAELGLTPVTDEVAQAARIEALPALGLPGSGMDANDVGGLYAGTLTGRESGFLRLTGDLATVIGAVSIFSALAYVEADYIGREGRQAAAVWRSGTVIIGPSLLGPTEPFDSGAAPISVALQALGVGSPPKSSFRATGLDMHRRTAEWARASSRSFRTEEQTP